MAPNASEADRAVTYECGQVVVVGRIVTTGSELLDADDNGIPWVSRSTSTVHVKRALVGSRKGAVLPVNYVSHARLRGDTDFMFVLSRNANSKFYGLIGATLMEDRPHLIQPCTPPTPA